MGEREGEKKKALKPEHIIGPAWRTIDSVIIMTAGHGVTDSLIPSWNNEKRDEAYQRWSNNHGSSHSSPSKERSLKRVGGQKNIYKKSGRSNRRESMRNTETRDNMIRWGGGSYTYTCTHQRSIIFFSFLSSFSANDSVCVNHHQHRLG